MDKLFSFYELPSIVQKAFVDNLSSIYIYNVSYAGKKVGTVCVKYRLCEWIHRMKYHKFSTPELEIALFPLMFGNSNE